MSISKYKTRIISKKKIYCIFLIFPFEIPCPVGALSSITTSLKNPGVESEGIKNKYNMFYHH